MGIFSKRRKAKWYFPGGRDLQLESGSNAALEMFRDDPLDSLTREICQNSLDARLNNDGPVKVTFKLLKKEISEIPGLDEIRKEIIKKAKKQWPNEANTQQMLQKMEEVLDQDYLDILKISDHNTTGLRQENWESLIDQVGSSVKKDSSSAGSFGIGKGAPFAVSDLRMVFYNTLADDQQKSIGVMKFVSFKEKDGGNEITTQGIGYLGKNGKEPLDKNVTFDDEIRKESGTDIYIIGINQDIFENWEEQIKLSLVDNFLLSIYKQKLLVDVNGTVINFAAVGSIIDEIKADKKLTKKYSNILSYYGVLDDEDRDVFYLTGLEKYGISEGEAILMSSQKVESNRRVLMTRAAGMKIYEQNNISGTLKFSGIFYADGKNINDFLKQVENPNHDKWSANRYKEPRVAQNMLKDLRRFIRESINQKYKEKIEDEVDAFGVSEFLPDDIESLNGKNKGSGPKETIEVELIQKNETNKTIVREYESNYNNDLTDDLEEIGKTPGEHGGSEAYGDGAGGGLGANDNNNGVGDEEGNWDKTSGSDYFNRGRHNRSKIARVKYRCIEVNYERGIYDLLVWADEDLLDVRLDVDLVGDSGNKGYVSVLNAETSNAHFETEGHSVYLPQLLKKKWQKIRIKLNKNTRLKLEVEVYAHPK